MLALSEKEYQEAGGNSALNNAIIYTLHKLVLIWSNQRRWCGGHVAGIEELENAYTVLIGRTKRRDDLEDEGEDYDKVLKSIIRKWGMRLWIWIQLSHDGVQRVYFCE